MLPGYFPHQVEAAVGGTTAPWTYYAMQYTALVWVLLLIGH